MTQKPPAKSRKQKREDNYTCSFCGAGFMREGAFLDHVCTQMQRHQKMKTPDGVSAWMAYSTWIKAQGKKVPPQTGFLSSRFYQSFIKFAEFVRITKTINIEQFVQHMVKLDIPPVIWTHDAIYTEWIRSTTAEKSPLKIVKQSTMFLMSHAEDNGFDIDQLFSHVSSSEVSDWIQTSKISPWFLLGSSKFKNWYATLDADDKNYFSRAFNPSEWIEKVRSNPKTMTTIKAIVAELGL